MTETLPKSIAITGASGGLGQALVKEYAEAGRMFFLAGRNSDRLNEARQHALSRNAQAQIAKFSLSDHKTLSSELSGFGDNFPIDLLIVNAGIKVGNSAGVENPDHMSAVIDVNLSAAIRTVQEVLPQMTNRGSGHIALISSMAAIAPQADLLSYSASKAGLRAYGIALGLATMDTGVKVSIVTPGFIETPMTDDHKGPTPLLMSAETAARRIRRGLDAQKRFITFPKSLAALIYMSNFIPTKWRDSIFNKFRAEINYRDN